MDEIFKLAGFCVCALILLDLLRQYSPGYAVLGALACCMVLLMWAASALAPVLEFVRRLAAGQDLEALSCVGKAVIVALLAQSVQDLCAQSGQTALAGRVELIGKAAVLLTALPLFSKLTETLTELL